MDTQTEEFEYDSWNRNNKYFVRVNFTKEIVEVTKEIFDFLKSESKPLTEF